MTAKQALKAHKRKQQQPDLTVIKFCCGLILVALVVGGFIASH